MPPDAATLDTAETRRVFFSPRWRAIGLVALVLLAYLPTLRNGFIWDDTDYIEHNVALRSLGGLWRIWSSFSATPQYYPLVHTTFWVEYHLWGLRTVGYHLDNQLLHLASVLLLWTLLRRFEVRGAWIIAAVWGVHPVNSESVAWITERKNVLSGAFYLGAFCCYETAIDWRAGGLVSRRRYALAAWLFLLALLSKTVTATFPAAVLGVIWWKRGRITRRDVWPLLPLLAAGVILGSITGYLERTQVGAHGREWNFTIVDRLLIAGRAVCFYAGKLLLPVRLSFIYPRWDIDAHDLRQYLFPMLVAGGLAALWLLRRRIGHGPIAAALFFVGTLLPALGFANVYPMRYSFVADHFQYLASIGGIALVVSLLWRAPTLFRTAVAAVLLPTLAVLTFIRCCDYRDRLTIWQATVRTNPKSWMARTNLGHALHDHGRDAEATVQYHIALQLDPTVPDTHLNVGIGDAIAGDYDGAIAQCQAAIAIDPTFTPGYANLAKAELSKGDLPAAQTAAEAALRLTPSYSLANNVLGHVRQQRGDFLGAMAAFSAALSANPDDADSHAHLADCLANTGHVTIAVWEYERALELNPNNAPAWTTLGNIFLATGRTPEAVECFQRALKIDPHFRPAQSGLMRTEQ